MRPRYPKVVSKHRLRMFAWHIGTSFYRGGEAGTTVLTFFHHLPSRSMHVHVTFMNHTSFSGGVMWKGGRANGTRRHMPRLQRWPAKPRIARRDWKLKHARHRVQKSGLANLCRISGLSRADAELAHPMFQRKRGSAHSLPVVNNDGRTACAHLLPESAGIHTGSVFKARACF